MNDFIKRNALTFGVIGFLVIGILIAFNLKINLSANATATSNASAISESVSKSKALSYALSAARAEATNNTYIINNRVKNVEWKTSVFHSRDWYDRGCIDGKDKWYCVEGKKLKPSIFEEFNNKPYPHLQRWLVVDRSLYVSYYENIKK